MRRPSGRMVLAFCLMMSGFTWPVFADWREEIGTFRVGIVAEPGAGNTIAGLADLNEAFGHALGMKVEFLVAGSYPALIDAQVSGRIDYAIYSASAYAAAYLRCECVEPLVAPTDENGSTGIRSVLIARDGRISSADDLAELKIALSPPDSIAGYQLPMATFRPGGRALSGAESFLVPAQSAEAAEAMLINGEADALFGWTPGTSIESLDIRGGTIDRLVSAGMDRQRLTIVWQSDMLRYGPHAVSNELDEVPKNRLKAFLTELRRVDPDMYERLETTRLGGFTPASQSDYEAALEVARKLAMSPAKANQ